MKTDNRNLEAALRHLPRRGPLAKACLVLLGRRGGDPDAAIATLEASPDAYEEARAAGRGEDGAGADLAAMVAATREDSRAHTVAELRAAADAAGVDTSAAKTKADLLDALAAASEV